MRTGFLTSNLIVAGVLVAACVANETNRSPSRNSANEWVATPVERLFSESPLWLDGQGPADLFLPVASVDSTQRAGEQGFPSLIRIQKESLDAFQLDPQAADVLETSNEEAAKKYAQIKQQMADLISEHPLSPAADEAKHLLGLLRDREKQAERIELASRKPVFSFGGVGFTR